MHDQRQLSPEIGCIDNVRVALHDVETLREQIPGWDALTKREKMRRARNVEPERVVESSNVTTAEYHELLVDMLHADQAVNEDITHLALGDDDATQPSSGDTALNNEVYRVAVTDAIDRGAELFTSTFLDSTEANGFDLVECGLTTDDGGGTDLLANHALINLIEKDAESTATIDVSLTFSNP